MKRLALLITFLAAAVLAACSGNFATGTSMPNQPGIPPVGTSPVPPMDQNGLPHTNSTGSPSPQASGDSGGSYPITDAQKGFDCPQLPDGYACTLAFNLPTPTPSPSASGKSKPTPTPSPTPTPTPTPSPQESGSASPSPSPTPTPVMVTLAAESTPKDAPAMVHVPVNTLDTVPLIMVTLTTTGDFPIDGWSNAQFTLPKSQIENRGFALQLFQRTASRAGTHYAPIWTFDKSTLRKTTLVFGFPTPKLTIGKGMTYVLVLYGDDKSSSSPSPSPSPSPSSSPSPSATGSALPSAQPSPTST
jgi:hypothetical protein